MSGPRGTTTDNTPLDNNDTIVVTRRDANGVGSRSSASVADIRGSTGWGDYVDTQYTEGSPFNPTTGTWNTLPNNAESGPRFQEPEGVEFYDATTQTITGRNGDGVAITIELTIKPTTNNSTFVDTAIDIGGAVGRIYPRTISLPRGNGVARTVSFTVVGYTLNTWEANGGLVQVNPTHAVDIYGIRYVITRTHKAL